MTTTEDGEHYRDYVTESKTRKILYENINIWLRVRDIELKLSKSFSPIWVDTVRYVTLYLALKNKNNDKFSDSDNLVSLRETLSFLLFLRVRCKVTYQTISIWL